MYFKKIGKLKSKVTPKCLENINKVTSLIQDFKFWDENGDPERNLFYWSILSNRIEIAKIFWLLGKVINLQIYINSLKKNYIEPNSKCFDCKWNIEIIFQKFNRF